MKNDGCKPFWRNVAFISALSQTGEPLKFDKTIERELTGGQADLYNIVLSTSQYLQIVVDQKGIDVLVTVRTQSSEAQLAMNKSQCTQEVVERCKKKAIAVTIRTASTPMPIDGPTKCK